MPERWKSRSANSFFLIVLLSAVNVSWAQPLKPTPVVQARILAVGAALGSGNEQAAAETAYVELPDAPGLQGADEKTGRSISGTVTDIYGAVVAGAQVTLSSAGAISERKLTTDGEGFFSFPDVEPGKHTVTVTSAGFSAWESDVVLQPGQSYDVPGIVLKVAVANTNVDVVYSRYDAAQEELKVQEGQRVLGIFPNFYVSYVPNAIPLTSGQKFRLALRSVIDPGSFIGVGFQAGIEQWQNDYPAYGEGAKGYVTRAAASFGDGFNSAMIAGAILPSILHQDPRYFYKGTGSTRSRALYAVSTVFICKGDNGRWQPNYSNVLGDFAAGGISNAYYPPASRGARLTIDNTLIGFAAGAVGDLFQEFLVKKISSGVHP